MAVVQISRIQVRRGKANSGTGIPQLASGEMAWALDTQELYIGNGSVAEGAPAVGNTKVLTELDLTVGGNIINLLKYVYKDGSGVQTGASANTPVIRTFQARFDDLAFATNFGVIGNGVANDTVALQRAIDQLFLNTTVSKSSVDTPDGVRTRVTLMLPAGIYVVTGTLYVPSYATIVGAGADKTIINFTGTGPVFRYVNDISNPGAPGTLAGTVANTRPKNILLKGMTVLTNTNNQIGLQLDAVTNCTFEDLIVKGVWAGTFNANSQGVAMNALSALVTCENNTFKNVTITGFSYGVWSKQDIINTTFMNCQLVDLRQGYVFGQGANGSTVGEQYGPRNTFITDGRFENVRQHGVYIERGTGSTVRNNKFINVGNNGGGNASAAFPQIHFGETGNTVENNESDRSNVLAGSTYPAVYYVPEVSGYATYKSYSTRTVDITQIDNLYLTAFRLPVSTNSQGGPVRSIAYTVDYVYRSTGNDYSRCGTLRLIVDVEQGTAALSDEYEVTGITDEDAVKFEFKATLLKADGTEYSVGLGLLPYSIAIQYQNEIPGDVGKISYSYTSTF